MGSYECRCHGGFFLSDSPRTPASTPSDGEPCRPTQRAPPRGAGALGPPLRACIPGGLGGQGRELWAAGRPGFVPLVLGLQGFLGSLPPLLRQGCWCLWCFCVAGLGATDGQMPPEKPLYPSWAGGWAVGRAEFGPSSLVPFPQWGLEV